MARFFCDEIQDDIALFHEDAKHMYRILRMQPGDRISVLDGQGMQYDGVMEQISEKDARARISNARKAEFEPDCRITLYQGLTRQNRLEYAIQKGVELGMARFVPVELKRCEVKAKDIKGTKRARYQKIAREAAKQCGRGIIPEVAEPVGLKEALSGGHELLICPYEEATVGTLKQAIHGTEAKDIGLIIGPEGGFDPGEVEEIQQAGGRIVTLGKRILRTETAGPAVIAMMMYEFDEVGV